jgi:hypothetical protein
MEWLSPDPFYPIEKKGVSMDVRLRALALVAAALCSYASAATVSVTIFESGLRDGAAAEASSAWENAVLEEFFESGNIVSNGETTRLDSPGLPSSSYGLAEALRGGAEYYIQIALVYGAAADRSRPSPQRAEYRISDNRGETIFQGAKQGLDPSINGKDDERNAHEIARILLGRMKKDR